MRKGKLFLVLTLSLMTLTLANSVLASDLTDDYLDIASNYYNSNNYAKALEYLNLILIIEPDNSIALTLKDKISPPPIDSSKSTGSATKILNSKKETPKIEIVTSQPNVENVIYDSNYYNKKGQDLYSKQEYNSAIEYFYKAVTLNKRNAQAYNNLAMSYWAKNNPDIAIRYFKKAISINKNYTQALVNLASLYKQFGNQQCQVYCLKRAIKYNPNDYLAYYWLGDYYRSINDYPRAIASYKEAIKINNKFSQAYLSLAISFFETEEFNYAILALNQYRELCPDSDYALFLMAKSNLALSRYKEAKPFVEKALEINSCNEYKFELAKIDYFLEYYTSAIDILQDLLNTQENAEYFNYMGLCNYKLRNIDAAIANFNKAIDVDGLRPIYYYNLAQCYKTLGDKKNYAKFVNSATKITPINYQDFIDLSYIYYDNSNPGYAINSLNSAINKYQNVKSLYLSKLKIYEALGDTLHYNETRDLIEKKFNLK